MGMRTSSPYLLFFFISIFGILFLFSSPKEEIKRKRKQRGGVFVTLGGGGVCVQLSFFLCYLLPTAKKQCPFSRVYPFFYFYVLCFIFLFLFGHCHNDLIGPRTRCVIRWLESR